MDEFRKNQLIALVSLFLFYYYYVFCMLNWYRNSSVNSGTMQEIPTLGIKPRLGSPHQWRCELRTQIIDVFDNFSQGIICFK